MAQRFIDEELIEPKKKVVTKPIAPVVQPVVPKPVSQPILPVTQTDNAVKLKDLQDSYLRAKAQYEAQQALTLQESAERLAFQKQQNEANRISLGKQATTAGQENYIASQQAQRVLPQQMANAGLSQTGYRSLAQKKMAESAQKGAQKIGSNLSAGIDNINLGEQGNNLDYNQNVRSAQNTYNQNIANLNLDRNQSVAKQYASQSSDKSSGAVNNLDDLILAGNTGRYSREQYKAALNVLGITGEELSGYMKNYDEAYALRNIQ